MNLALDRGLLHVRPGPHMASDREDRIAQRR
jgi:hypothetical protein